MHSYQEMFLFLLVCFQSIWSKWFASLTVYFKSPMIEVDGYSSDLRVQSYQIMSLVPLFNGTFAK